VRLDFDVTSDRSIAQASLYYRIHGETKYKRLILRKDPNLRYTVLVPGTQTVECYLSLKAETGQGAVVWSADSPLLIPAEGLEHKPEARPGWTTRTKLIVTGVVGLVLTALAIGAIKASKH